MKRRSIIFVFLSLIFFACSAGHFNYPSSPVVKLKKIVIDPGHGGQDPGAVGKHFRESDLTLAIALQLGAKIKERFPDVEVVYTRKTDVFVELYKRAKIANECRADLFISIHINASKNTAAVGTETFVMGLHKTQANLEVSKLENSSILFEEDYADQYDGFNPNSPEAHIIFTLFQNVFLDQSLNLAAKVQNQFDKRLGRVNRGVKQAGFLVLYKATMPSILIEAGFISNLEEEQFIGSSGGQDKIVDAIFRAFSDYKADIEGLTVTDDPDEVIEVVPPKDTIKPEVQQPVVKDTVVKENVAFRVQFATSPTKKPTNSQEFSHLTDVRVYYHSSTYKYTSGNFTSVTEAINYQKEVQQKGFKDAFVVAFVNEERVSVEKAEEVLKNQKK